MAVMHVPTFSPLSAVEQCEQLENYLKELNPSLSFTTVDRLMFGANIQEVITGLDVVMEQSKESDVESVMNAVVTLLFELPTKQEETKNLIETFASTLADKSSDKLAPVSLRVVKNLHDGLFESLELQYIAYTAMVKLATKAKRLPEVFTDVESVKSKYSVETIGFEKAQNLYRLLKTSALDSGRSELASQIMIELLSTYTEENASQAEQDAVTCITSFLKDPNTFLLDHLLALKPVLYLEGKPIFDLLTIFVSEKLQNYIEFYNKNKSFVDGLGLNHEQNLQKMRLLTFMQMAEGQKEISYETIMAELKIEHNEVEPFVFDVLRTQLVRAKIDQLNKKVLVQSTMHRTFGRPQWEQLRTVLSEWRNNFAHIEKTIRMYLAQSS
uniref:Eukaryotic translation initiation factor 3 subunit M n=1 Tax=Aceria tosichella TaxID=561515 RepID=A0A6G1SLS4_9ACAR